MIDGYHWYSRMEALKIGRALERLNFTWFEEMMSEQSIASYAWLAGQLDIPILGPETAAGKHWTRADWVKAGACDILRAGVPGVGGIGPTLKVAHLAESFGMDCEVHGSSAGNLAVCAAIKNCRWYERGLLHPFLDYDEVPPYLNSLWDPMDADGYVHPVAETRFGRGHRSRLRRSPYDRDVLKTRGDSRDAKQRRQRGRRSDKSHDPRVPVSYTHLTLPTKA